MPISTTYTIKNTQGDLSFTINVGSANGPNELTQQADVTFYGYGRTGWGQEVDQNFYRLLENFACNQKTSNPPTPSTKAELGGVLGVNKPVKGQHWFNLSTTEMYVCTDGVANTWKHLISETYADTKYLQIADASGSGANAFVKLNGSNSPMTGYLTLYADPVNALHAATKGYTDTAITNLSNASNGLYVHKAGDTGIGPLTLSTGAGLFTTLNQGNIEIGRTDGTGSTPYVDFHSSGGNIDYDSRIIASAGNTSVAGQGTMQLIGYIVSDGRTPTLANQFVNKAWMDSQIAAAVSSITSSSNSLYVKKAGDTMTGILNMGGHRIAGLGYPAVGTDAARVDWSLANLYSLNGTGGSRQIFMSTGGPSGGSSGDIWIKY